jgi:hypothetical protein
MRVVVIVSLLMLGGCGLSTSEIALYQERMREEREFCTIRNGYPEWEKHCELYGEYTLALAENRRVEVIRDREARFR